MGYPLERLLKVRKLREDAAETEVNRCTRELKEAEDNLQQRKDKLAEYTKWRLAEEERLFQEIKGHEIHLKEIDDYKLQLQSLRGREVKLEEKILEARKQIEDCKEALEEARKLRLQAMRGRRKIEEHNQRWDEEQRVLEERAEDLELEEFTGHRPEFIEDEGDK